MQKNFLKDKYNSIKSKIESTTTAIKLGSYSSHIYKNDIGCIIKNEASMIAFKKGEEKEIYNFGNNAKKIAGKIPFQIETENIIENGKITNPILLEEYIMNYLSEISSNKVIKQKAIINSNSIFSKLEETIIKEIAEKCGFFDVYLIKEVTSAAIGCGIDISKPNGVMIIDLGYTKTEISIISMGFVVKSKKINIAGRKFDEDIKNFILHKYNLITTREDCEELKIAICSINFDKRKTKETTIHGRDLASGKIRSTTISSEDLTVAISKSLVEISKEIKDFINSIPPEFIIDIKNFGIILSGGTSNIENINLFISKIAKLPVFRITKPEEASIRGMSIIAKDLEKYSRILE